MYRLARKRTAKKRAEENASVSFFHDHVCIGLQRLLTVDRRNLIRRHSSRLSGFSECAHHKRKAVIRFFRSGRS